MLMVARRIAIALGASVVAWFAIVLVAERLFGSANFLAYVFAAVVGAAVYLAILRRDRRSG